MLKKLLIFIASAILASSAFAENQSAENLKDYRCVSNGLRLPLVWRASSQPRIFSRYRRKAMVDLKGELKLVFPTFYMDRILPDKIVKEYPYPNDVQIQAGIEPSFKMSNENLDTSPRILGNDIITYKKGDKETYRIITVDLGDTVVKKGDWFGIWVALENLDGTNNVPFTRLIGDSKEQIYECSYTSAGTSFIEDNFIKTATKLPLIKLERNYIVGFSPVAILAKTDYTGDVWAIIGSSIPEGYYDINGNQYGDENANIGYADKLISTNLGVPSVNLSKGADRLEFCANELKGRMDIIKICGVTKLHAGLGGNDLYSKLDVLKDSAIKINKQIKDFNPEIITVGGTITPRSKSADDFKTLENQTPGPHFDGTESRRGKWNKILRTNCKSVGFDEVFELCSYVEYDWKNSSGTWDDKNIIPKNFTVDGTHPTCAGGKAIADHAYIIKQPK
ncbi:MAG: hypothetical protein PF692_01425 [Kiritimatiellae bacterium]|nr:hypothetical protein [Kiritimatiellia bacterium]